MDSYFFSISVNRNVIEWNRNLVPFQSCFHEETIPSWSCCEAWKDEDRSSNSASMRKRKKRRESYSLESTIEFPRGDAERSASKSLHARKKRNGFLRTESRDNRPRMTPIYSPPEIYRRKLLRTSWELVGELDEILETNCLLLARLFDKTCGNSRYRRISDDDLSLRTKIAKRNCICLYLNIFLSANRGKIFKLRNFTSYHL